MQVKRGDRLWRALATQHTWLRVALKFRGSVLPVVLPRTILCGMFGLLISFLYDLGIPISAPPALASLISVVLGLMLVFRTNTAYERFWEGRKLWGSINNAIRNLARQIWITVLESQPGDRNEKIAVLHLLAAFAVATKLHLRQEPVNEELESLLSLNQGTKLKLMNNPPLEIALWIQDYLQQQYYRNALNIHQLTGMQQLINGLVDHMGGCERILKTPIPMAYAIHLKQVLLVYCLTLPLQFVNELNWWTGLLVALISFTLFGIEEIGIEIENPFGRDPNDLPLDAICETIKRNIADLITVEPVSAKMYHAQTNPLFDTQNDENNLL
jgi:putative membrane protein